MPLSPGTRLGPYDILSPLGAGGMGEVYRACDPRLGRELAIKVLPEDVASHPDRLARFEREARSVAALNHPNVVTLYSIEESEGVRFLAMELVEGENLDRIVQPGGLPLARVLELGIQLADALTAAHERGVVHRDFKPANVMVTREGRVKVLDFGLAKRPAAEPGLDATQAATVLAPLSSAGLVVGTIPYMAPEQIRGVAVDARTDLFSFGVVLYELLTGKRPFQGATAADVTSAILRDVPPPVRSTRADLPDELDRIVARCLEKEPGLRFPSARSLRQAMADVRRALQAGGHALTTAARVVPAGSREIPSIAVLPFANRSQDKEDEYFAEGLADELLSVLVKIRGLRVAARTSSARFKDATEDVASIGQKLNVATLLEGSVRKAGSRVRISVQLVKVADGYQLWSQTFDRTLEDIFAVQDDIAQAVVKELRTTLLGEVADSKASGEAHAEVAAAAVGRGTHAEAHRLYLQGRHFTNRLNSTDMGRGITLLRQAVELEPSHSLAWAALAWAETTATVLTGAPMDVSIERARRMAARALEQQPDLAEGHFAVGSIQLWHDFDWLGAEASFRRALELSPNDAEMLRANAIIHHIMLRHDEALVLSLRAVEQDPLSVSSYTYAARAYAALRRLPDAEQAYRRAIDLAPEAALTHCLLALVLVDSGRLEEALVQAQKEPAAWARWFALAVVSFHLGQQEASDSALRQLREGMGDFAAYQIACAYAIRGEPDEAFEWLERAWAQRDAGVVMVRVHHQLDSLRSDPRWPSFLAKLRFPD